MTCVNVCLYLFALGIGSSESNPLDRGTDIWGVKSHKKEVQTQPLLPIYLNGYSYEHPHYVIGKPKDNHMPCGIDKCILDPLHSLPSI